jgi:hypothetical protein
VMSPVFMAVMPRSMAGFDSWCCCPSIHALGHIIGDETHPGNKMQESQSVGRSEACSGMVTQIATRVARVGWEEDVGEMGSGGFGFEDYWSETRSCWLEFLTTLPQVHVLYWVIFNLLLKDC